MYVAIRSAESTGRRRPGWIVALVLLGAIGGGYGVWQGIAWHHWRQANRLIEQREFRDAQEHVAACLDAWPSSGAVHILAARNARQQKQPLDAFRTLDEALRLGGDVERIVLERYLLRAERGEMSQVEKKLLAFLHKDDPDAIFILDVLTYQWMLTHRLGEALTHLGAWLKLQPNHPEPHVRRAWVLERLRDVPAALDEYQQALNLDPERDRRNDDRVRLRVAELMLERFRAKEALGHFETLVERQPKNPAVRFGLARSRLVLGETDDGLRILQELLAEQPNHGQALCEMGRVFLQQEKLPLAEAALARGDGALPTDRQTVYSLEQCLQKLGKKAEAKELQRQLDEMRVDELQMAELMTTIKHSPDDPDLRQRIGAIFLRNGLVDDGLLWLNSALLYAEDHTATHEVLAEWWESRSANDKAAPHRQILKRLGVAARPNRFLGN